MLKGNLSRFLPRFFKKTVSCGLTGQKTVPRSGSLSGENLIVWDFFDWVAQADISIRVRINSLVINKKLWVKIGSTQRDLESLQTFLSVLLQIWIHYHQSKETENSLHAAFWMEGKQDQESMWSATTHSWWTLFLKIAISLDKFPFENEKYCKAKWEILPRLKYVFNLHKIAQVLGSALFELLNWWLDCSSNFTSFGPGTGIWRHPNATSFMLCAFWRRGMCVFGIFSVFCSKILWRII